VKILITSRLYPSSACPSRGTFVHNQARFLAQHCDVEVISPTPFFLPVPGLGKWSAYGRVPRLEVRDGLSIRYPRYLSLPGRRLFGQAWRFYLGAVRRALAHRPELIHAHLAYPDGLAAAHLARALGVPLVISVHGHDVREIPAANPRWGALVAAALRQADRVVHSSTDVRQRLLALGCAAGQLEYVPQGVDCQLFRPGPVRGGAPGPWRLLYVGRLDQRKGIGVLLESLALLRRRRTDVVLTLIGGSPVSGTAAAFREQAVRAGVQECVEFVDALPWEQIAPRMAAADVIVLPSFYDSFGIVLIEAMACGRPVVATRCGGPADIVTDQTGLLVRPGDAADLARGLDQVLTDYGRYDPAAIRRHVEARYDYRQIALRLIGMYRQLLGGSAASAPSPPHAQGKDRP